MRPLLALLTCLLLWMSVPFGTSASAQSTADETSYEQVLAQAVTAHGAQQWLAARALFERAHALRPNARTLRGMGVCAFEAGLYPLAVRDLEAALAHPERPLTGDLRGAVEVLLEAARAEVGAYRVRMQPEHAQLRIDDVAPTLAESGEVLLAPGAHVAEVSLEGHLTQTVPIDAQRGDRREIHVMLPVAPATSSLSVPASTVAAPDSESAHSPASDGPRIRAQTAAPAAPDRPRSSLRMRGSAIAASALSGLSLATAGALYGVARGRIRDIGDRCEARIGGGCSSEEAHALERNKDVPVLERAVTGTLVIGITAAATAAVLWTLDVRARRRLARAGLPFILRF
jgi:hypothetical protein